MSLLAQRQKLDIAATGVFEFHNSKKDQGNTLTFPGGWIDVSISHALSTTFKETEKFLG